MTGVQTCALPICGHAKDVLQKMSDAPLTECPQCDAPSFRKQLTAAGFQLKGSGWYATDFRGTDGKSQNGKSADAPAADSASPDGKSVGASAPASAATTAAPAEAPAGKSGGSDSAVKAA